MKLFFTGLAGAMLGGWCIALLYSYIETRDTLPKGSVAQCAVIEQPELRETKGVATYEVTIVDGEWRTITCTSNPNKDDD